MKRMRHKKQYVSKGPWDTKTIGKIVFSRSNGSDPSDSSILNASLRSLNTPTSNVTEILIWVIICTHPHFFSQAHSSFFYTFNILLLQCPPLNWIANNRISRLMKSEIAEPFAQNTRVNWIIWLLLSLLLWFKVIILSGGHCIVELVETLAQDGQFWVQETIFHS